MSFAIFFDALLDLFLVEARGLGTIDGEGGGSGFRCGGIVMDGERFEGGLVAAGFEAFFEFLEGLAREEVFDVEGSKDLVLCQF